MHLDARDDGDEARADGRHLEVQCPGEKGRQRERNQRRRHALGPARQEREHREREQADQQLGASRSVARLHVRPDPLEEMVGSPRRSEAKQILDLQDADHGADAGGEPGRHWMRDELDQPAQSEQAHRQEQDSRHPAGDQKPGEPLPDKNGRENDDEGCGWPGDLEA